MSNYHHDTEMVHSGYTVMVSSKAYKTDILSSLEGEYNESECDYWGRVCELETPCPIFPTTPGLCLASPFFSGSSLPLPWLLPPSLCLVPLSLCLASLFLCCVLETPHALSWISSKAHLVGFPSLKDHCSSPQYPEKCFSVWFGVLGVSRGRINVVPGISS